MKTLFGTDGIRGEAGTYPLDAKTVARVGEALAKTLLRQGGADPPRVLIGRDTRESGSWIERALAGGLSRAGAECLAAGVIPTPGVAYLARKGGFSAGVMISASHNPYQDNGIKVFSASGYKLDDQIEADIERIVLQDGATSGVETTPATAVPAPDLVSLYVDFLRSTVDPAISFEGMTIVVDCANGASSAIAPPILAALGADVTTVCNTPDGRNINEECGSLHPERLASIVVERGADLGVAFDGDADRTLFVSSDGRVADGDVLLYQAACDLKRRGRLAGDRVVATVMSNLWLERDLSEIGITMIRTQVGDKYVIEEMRRSGASLGGEPSGHIIFADHATTGDGVMTALKLLEILRANGDTVSGWLARVRACPQVLLNVPVASRPDLETHPVIGPEVEQVRRTLGDGGRLVLRYSGTESLARVMIEAGDRETVERLARRLAGVIEQEIGTRR